MKVITSIYMSIRPDLRDEWLTGTEPDDGQDRQERLLLLCMRQRIDQSTAGPRARLEASGQVL